MLACIETQVSIFGNNASDNAAQDNNFAEGFCFTSVTKVVDIEDLGKDLSEKNDSVVEDYIVLGVLRDVSSFVASVPGVLRGVSNIAARGSTFIKVVEHSPQYHPIRRPDRLYEPARRRLPRVRRGPSDHIPTFPVMSHDDTRTTGTMSPERDNDGDKHLELSWHNASQNPA